MKISKKVLGRVEGEVELRLRWKKGKVEDAFVIAPNYRGFEEILRGKPYLDALIITPRVCGICGHAHLIACVEAIESAYRKKGAEVKLSPKATLIRELTLSCELIQNHLRWFYLYLIPDLIKLEPSLGEEYVPLRGKRWHEALKASNFATKVIALFGGQWPHTSYAFPGGITCDPTSFEVMQAKEFLRSLKTSLEDFLTGMKLEEYVELKGRDLLTKVSGDIGKFVEISFSHGLDRIGSSYHRFLSKHGVLYHRLCKFDPLKVKESNGKGYSWSKTARYNGYPFETGPLARRMTTADKTFRYLSRKFGDSVMVRVLARLDELVRLTLRSLQILEEIDLSQPSWEKPPVDIDTFSGKGIGVVEASRGTLIHKVEIEKGRIKSYDIITPTVWNLGPRDDNFLGVVEKALIGLDSELKAEIVLRSFDVCSVCTSH